MAKTLAPFDKYAAYSQSVQSPEEDVKILRRVYRELTGNEPHVMREDFCGAFALCCEWAKLGEDKRAIGLDIDPEALAYGRKNYLPLLDAKAQRQIKILKRNVLSPSLPSADIICALNFSYFIFHQRPTLLKYFSACRRSLRSGGLMMVDLFGGSECQEASIDTHRYPGLTYYWEQQNFDPINHHARFRINFKPKGGRLRKGVFTYDWRMWTIPEVRDLMIDAGFRKVDVYWEGTARDGTGSGKFHRRTKGEACDVWIAYVVASI
jgi:SAM-dependent methyltransferase